MPSQIIEERKAREKEARRLKIIEAARRIAAAEGWPNVTVRRLADDIAYSQPVLYSHFASREEIISAVAVQGFQELGEAMEKARKRASQLTAVADAYLGFSESHPALYEAMFALSLTVPFADPNTPEELRFAFSQFMHLFEGEGSKAQLVSELFWASLHGIAELTRTNRLPLIRRKDRVREIVDLFRSKMGKHPD